MTLSDKIYHKLVRLSKDPKKDELTFMNFIKDEDVREFIKVNSEFSEEEGKSVICKDTFQEGFDYAISRMKKLAGKELST